ncbi:LysR family transcriptional regulator [Streptomyces sp. Ru73]|uniref:LysR family transcriptional regulator n=1 Tax=Streptomyces sp. Ru73 TaxID=2080748 RepID=UPI000CDD9478|nr:LysR family transcriptional regulator [Streptomyces sp. Ru73]POX38594.1 LysR family transcriptional regulator [Streptomyces sp. Ru73]
MLTWERLRVFAAVAHHGSVGAAADALHVTGPAVSQHLRRLEKEAGCRLVEPEGRGIRLTHAGRILAATAQQMATAASHAARDLATISGLVAGPLRVGAVASALRALIPQALQRLQESYPRLEPEVWDGEAAEMIPSLRTGQLDAVVMESWAHCPARIPPGIRTTPLVHENALLAVHERHPLAHLDTVPLSSLHGQVWATCAPGSDAHQALVQLLNSHRVTDMKVRYCVADYATQLQLVASGLAAALVPSMAIPAAHEGVRLIPCRPAVTRTVAVATAHGTETPPIHAFIAEMKRAGQHQYAGER